MADVEHGGQTVAQIIFNEMTSSDSKSSVTSISSCRNDGLHLLATYSL